MTEGIHGTVYLLHFEPKFHHAGHYLGWTGNAHGDVSSRLHYHLNGQGSRLVAAAVGAGCEIEVVRTWEDVTRNFERRLKSHGHTRICPWCAGMRAFGRGQPR